MKRTKKHNHVAEGGEHENHARDKLEVKPHLTQEVDND